jgi:hypothetical protein
MGYGFEDVNVLVGKTLTEIQKVEDDEIYFVTSDEETYRMWHYQDCCEDVTIEDIIGDLDDLIGSPITLAEEVTSNENPLNEEWDESFTWTFYKFATNKGYVTIRWYGTSNGYYSESVDFAKIKE